MKYNFDEIIERRSTRALKWMRYEEDIIPLWVADADYKTAPAIINRLKDRVEHGIFGYHIAAHNESANTAIVNWIARRHNWHIEPEWIIWLPGVVAAVHLACGAFCNKGDKVLVQTPNYPPLLAAPEQNNLQIETVATVQVDGRWTLDFDQLESKAADPDASLFILCNPMNPCGSVMTRQELERIESICLENNLTLCSDEIHCDLVLDEMSAHIPAGSLEKIGHKSITLMAASKTFNIAGLGSSVAIIADPQVRRDFSKTTNDMQLWVNILGMLATETAFTICDDWYDEQLDYLRANRDYLKQAFSQLDGFDYNPSEATYLAWVDASALAVKDVQQYMLGKGVGPSAGQDFGWQDFTRINFACPRNNLEQTIARLSKS